MTLDILVVPTYDVYTLAIVDATLYPDDPPVVTSPTIEITVPGFDKVVLAFNVGTINVFNSTTLEIGDVDDPLVQLPDGIYYLKYSVAPAYINFVEKSIIRVDKLQEKFDEAFLKLDMMECDRAIRKQSKVNLNSIYFFIQGAIAAANICAIEESSRLYIQANKMLDSFIANNCGCSGNNYFTNFL